MYPDVLSVSASLEERPCFYKSQVEKTKAIHALITKDLTSIIRRRSWRKESPCPQPR